MRKIFFDWKIHVFCFVFVIASELIGNVVVGPWIVLGANIGFTIFPMLFALLFGIISYSIKLIDKKTAMEASPYIGIATMWLIVNLAAGIGPNLRSLLNSGPVFVLQEFGNLGTALLAMPIAVFVFSMGRQAIGASFSKSREGSIAVVSSMYGLDSQEGQGIMGAYVVGTVVGTLFCGILASIVVSTGFFNPIALAMASGSGSASMMMAFLAPLEDAYPHMWNDLVAYASMSNLITSATGIYFSMFIVIPVCNWLYKIFNGEARHKKRLAKLGKVVVSTEMKAVDGNLNDRANETKEKVVKESFVAIWITRLKILLLSGVFATLANWINTGRNESIDTVAPFVALPGLLLMAIPILLGYALDDFMRQKTKLNVPVILYVSLIGIIMSVPGFPLAEEFSRGASLIGLLPLAVPILSYAGISIGKDMKSFKEQGLAIICITLLAFAGTYLGSAIIAHIYLTLIG